VRPFRQVILTEHPAMERFFARRCPHLAGMIAYFGILSIIPAAFLVLSALAWVGALDPIQNWLVDQLGFVFGEQNNGAPSDAVKTILRTTDYLRENSGSLGIIGALGLVWGTSNFFSCIESGLNIIYGVNNRYFFKQKGLVLVLMVTALMFMTLSMLAVVVSLPLLRRAELFTNTVLRLDHLDYVISVVVSLVFAFFFFLGSYRFLPNTDIHTRDVWRGSLMAAVLFEGSVQMLPRWFDNQGDSIVVTAFSGALALLVWFYLMAFVLLAGGVYNWWYVEKRRRASDEFDTSHGLA
jgi:membrane protein